jgi:sulfur-oxidizing protein SoxX
MRKPATLAAVASLATLLGGVFVAPEPVHAEAAEDVIKNGKAVAMDRRKGNCISCHMMDDGVSPGNLGPPLVAMKARFPDKEKLRSQIYDPETANANTRMPPFGKHGILTSDELDAVIEYVYTL